MGKSACIQAGKRKLTPTSIKRYIQTPLARLYIVYLHVHNMLEKGKITEDTCRYLTTDIDRTQLFYMLPTIHKGLNNYPRQTYSFRKWLKQRKKF